jgi:hypothetical protein
VPIADLSALGGFHDIHTNFPNAPLRETGRLAFRAQQRCKERDKINTDILWRSKDAG